MNRERRGRERGGGGQREEEREFKYYEYKHKIDIIRFQSCDYNFCIHIYYYYYSSIYCNDDFRLWLLRIHFIINSSKMHYCFVFMHASSPWYTQVCVCVNGYGNGIAFFFLLYISTTTWKEIQHETETIYAFFFSFVYLLHR